MNNTGLITAAQRGDLTAFNRLARDHQDEAYTLAFYLLGDENLATSATQFAFLKAYQELRGYRLPGGPRSFRTWLLRQVMTACAGLQPATGNGNGSAAGGEWPVTGRGGEEGKLWRRLHQLPSECLAAVVLVDMLGLDYEAAVHASGLPLERLRSCLALGRAHLANAARSPIPAN